MPAQGEVRASSPPSHPQNTVPSKVRFERQEIHLTINKGPLPPAEQIQQYNDAVPGIGDRIVRMAEKEQDHRHYLDRKDIGVKFSGLVAAAVMVIGVIFGAIYLIANGHQTSGTIFGGVSIISLVSLFNQAIKILRMDRNKINDSNGQNGQSPNEE